MNENQADSSGKLFPHPQWLASRSENRRPCLSIDVLVGRRVNIKERNLRGTTCGYLHIGRPDTTLSTMIKTLTAAITLLAAGGVFAVPHPVANEKPTRTQPLSKRATTVCGQWDSVQTGGYTVYNNLWGKDSGTGSQCLTVDGVSSGLLSWSTTWSWSGGQYNVKSYPNAVVSAPAARLSAISSIPTRWQWR